MLRTVAPAPEPCDCPGCSGAELDPAALIDDLIDGGATLLGIEDPLEAELFAANLLALGNQAGEGFAEALAGGIIPALEEIGSPEALAVLHAVAALEEGTAAADAAARLTGSGVPSPGWAAELRQPVEAEVFLRFADTGENLSVLVATFSRAGRSHGFSVNVVHGDCHSATEILLFPGTVLDQVIDMIQNNEGARDLVITRSSPDPESFRWETERALNARADHDQDTDEPAEADPADEESPDYHLSAELLRARLRLLPAPSRPPARHGD
ncbi:hypothetical protein [Actinoplanes derwentensis]|uniref:Uncharacterized protein n=1 Tax=Actinoplanes derwentensis TaxID=113562 RepID=A0A1H1Z139_9ACTN|nr:hypothetical protein [Actinoplanes derwentensis]GID81376.1 hypothetical protein Ade03nite_03000 [Actinoplanes derwentensis]SDT27319.1 hypothetical protein SAMN04489716_3084 [Actinoplanes derwentensis]